MSGMAQNKQKYFILLWSFELEQKIKLVELVSS